MMLTYSSKCVNVILGDGTHNKKLQTTLQLKNHKGRIPIKNNADMVNVVDEQGVKYSATYFKRARGLVKHGRARFVDDNTICLACPPIHLEDNNMNNVNEYRDNNGNIINKNECLKTSEITIENILDRIDKIISQNNHILEALNSISEIKVIAQYDTSSGAKAQAIAEVVKVREATNQNLIKFLKEMYNDIKPQPRTAEEMSVYKLNAFRETLNGLPEESIKGIMQSAAASYF